MPQRKLYRARYRVGSEDDEGYASDPQPLEDALAQVAHWIRQARDCKHPLLQAVLVKRVEAGEHITVRGAFLAWEQWVEEVA